MARFDFVSLSSSLAPNQRSVLTVLSHDIRTVSLTLLRLPILLGTGLSQDDPSAGILPFSTQAPGEAEVIYDGPGEPVWIKAGRMQKNGQRTISLSTFNLTLYPMSYAGHDAWDAVN